MSLLSVVSSFFWGATLFVPAGQLIEAEPQRNPFISLSISVGCPEEIIDEENRLLNWQLGGIIGTEAERQVWLQIPMNTWMIVGEQTKLPLAYWKLRKIDSGAAVFSLNNNVSDECYDERVIEFKFKDK